MAKKFGTIVVISLLALASAENLPRQDAKAQNADLSLYEASSFAPLHLGGANNLQNTKVAIEILQVLELPINVHEAALVKQEKGYALELSLANSTESKMLGLRYALNAIDSKNRAQPLANRTEGISLPAYTSKTLTFKFPKFRLKDGERLVLMLEQVISRESIWEVVKAKEALDLYARGDYSATPVVLRVANHVDVSPVDVRPIRQYRYFKQ